MIRFRTPTGTPGHDAGDSPDPALAAAAAAAADAASLVAARRSLQTAADFMTVDLRATSAGHSSPVMRALFDVREQAPVLLLTVRTQ